MSRVTDSGNAEARDPRAELRNAAAKVAEWTARRDELMLELIRDYGMKGTYVAWLAGVPESYWRYSADERTDRRCANCGDSIDRHLRSDAIYCPGGACKQAAWREEQGRLAMGAAFRVSNRGEKGG